jgi:hypothetical protein
MNAHDPNLSDSEIENEVVINALLLKLEQEENEALTSLSQKRCRTSVSGSAYIEELFASAHTQRCFEVLRMSLDTFYALRDWFLQHTKLLSSTKTDGPQIEEKMIIFLHIVTRGASNRDTQERFARSGRTISK